MIVLGIDPGLERVGYGVVERQGSQLRAIGHGLIQTPRIATAERLRLVYRGVKELIEVHRPELSATEKLFFAKNQTTAIDVAKALGVIHLALAESALPILEFSPPEVKLAVVGNGAAEKRQVQFMVVKLLGLAAPPKPDDVADALAVAITAALRTGGQRPG